MRFSFKNYADFEKKLWAEVVDRQENHDKFAPYIEQSQGLDASFVLTVINSLGRLTQCVQSHESLGTGLITTRESCNDPEHCDSEAAILQLMAYAIIYVKDVITRGAIEPCDWGEQHDRVCMADDD